MLEPLRARQCLRVCMCVCVCVCVVVIHRYMHGKTYPKPSAEIMPSKLFLKILEAWNEH